jgi:NAD(P)-dependent dehydrogenase (short-subunit alcohol dehydrogenase family)
MTRTAVVTGGMSGIGAAIAERLRSDGLRVLVADLAAGAEMVLDISAPEQVADHAAVLGEVDVLVNCAGVVGPNRPLWEVSPEDWRKTLEVNLDGAFLMCRATIPGMRERGWGRIVNIASVAGKEGNPNLSAYSASKAGLIGMTKSLGKELATDGVLVNAVAPAVIATPMNEATAPEVLDYMVAKIPMQRLGRPDEVAELVSWLVSERCSFSTAAVFDLTGGRATY